MYSIRSIHGKILLAIIIIFLLLWTLIPFYSMIITSLSPFGELPTSLFDISDRLTLDYFKEVLFDSSTFLWKNMMNSFIVASLVTVIVLVCAVFAGYSFSRSNYVESKVLFYFLLVIRMVPPILLIIPLFVLAVKFKLMDTYWGLVLAHIPLNIPFAIWLIKGFFDGIPVEMEEAAWIDGASMPRTIFSVVLPLVMPGVAVTAVFIFLNSYIEYIFALTLSRSQMITLPIKIAGYMTAHQINYQGMSAAALISTIPMILIFIYIRKYIVAGLTLGAVK